MMDRLLAQVLIAVGALMMICALAAWIGDEPVPGPRPLHSKLEVRP
ncbi:hypothetical protein [Methylobacterium fujisawaense]